MLNWQLLHPDFAAKLTELNALLKANGLKMRGTSGYRSLKEQAMNYAKGRTTPGPKVTNAPPGASAHNWGCAADFVFVNRNGKATYEGPWALFGSLVKKLGLFWGGDIPKLVDRCHCELKTWRCVRDKGWQPKVKGE